MSTQTHGKRKSAIIAAIEARHSLDSSYEIPVEPVEDDGWKSVPVEFAEGTNNGYYGSIFCAICMSDQGSCWSEGGDECPEHGHGVVFTPHSDNPALLLEFADKYEALTDETRKRIYKIQKDFAAGKIGY